MKPGGFLIFVLAPSCFAQIAARPATCGNLANSRCVDAANSARWAGAAPKDWINSAAADCGTTSPCTIVIAPDVPAGAPTFTNKNVTYFDYRTGTPANPETNLRFPFGLITYNIFDASPNSRNSLAQAESYALPVLNVTVTATGSGVPVPGYFYVFNRSPTADHHMAASNSVGLIAGCESNGAMGDRHSGCWGANFLAASDGNASSPDQSIFGLETNIFIERKDPGRFSVRPRSQPKFGIVSTNNGTYPSQVAFLSSQSNGDRNAPYDGFLCDRALDDCFIAGTPGALNKTPYGFRASARGDATSDRNPQSLPFGWFGSIWNGSAPQDDVWQAENEPLPGTNPATYWVLRHNSALELNVSSAGNLNLSGRISGYSTLPTAGTGIAPNLGSPLSLTGQTSNLPATTIYTTRPSGPGSAGLYRVCVATWTTNPGNTTSLQANIVAYNGAGLSTTPVGPALNLSSPNNATGGTCTAIHVAASQPIQVSTSGYSSTGAYSIQATVEQLL